MEASQSNNYMCFVQGLEHVYLDDNIKGPTVFFEFEDDNQADVAFNRVRDLGSHLGLHRISSSPENAKHPTIGFSVKMMGTKLKPITDVHELLTKLGRYIGNSDNMIAVPVTYIDWRGKELSSGAENNFDEKMRRYQVETTLSEGDQNKENKLVSDVHLLS